MKLSSRLTLCLYKFVTVLIAPLGAAFLAYKKRRDPPYGRRIFELLGYYKETEKGVGTMCKALEDMRNEAVEKATQQIQIANAKAMLADGILTVEQAAKYFNLPIDLVRKIAGEVGA